MSGRVSRYTLAQVASLVGPDAQTVMVPLFEGQQFNTDGTAGSTLLDVTNDLIAEIAPYSASVQAYTAMENKSANFRWKIQFQGSTTGRTYGAVTDLFAFLSSNGESTQAAYTSMDNLGRKTRWALTMSPSAGTAVESGILWCYLAFRLRR